MNFENWPENLPRAELVRLLRGFASEAVEVEKLLGIALGYPLGDGEVCPDDQPVVGEHTPVTLAMQAADRIRELDGDKQAAFWEKQGDAS